MFERLAYLLIWKQLLRFIHWSGWPIFHQAFLWLSKCLTFCQHSLRKQHRPKMPPRLLSTSRIIIQTKLQKFRPYHAPRVKVEARRRDLTFCYDLHSLEVQSLNAHQATQVFRRDLKRQGNTNRTPQLCNIIFSSYLISSYPILSYQRHVTNS